MPYSLARHLAGFLALPAALAGAIGGLADPGIPPHTLRIRSEPGAAIIGLGAGELRLSRHASPSCEGV